MRGAAAGPGTGGGLRRQGASLSPLYFAFLFSSSSVSLFSPFPFCSFTPVPSSLCSSPRLPTCLRADACPTALCPSQLSSALLFDALYAVVTAVRELNRSQEIGVKALSCGSAQIWQHGTSLMNYLRMVRWGGWGKGGAGGQAQQATGRVASKILTCRPPQ